MRTQEHFQKTDILGMTFSNVFQTKHQQFFVFQETTNSCFTRFKRKKAPAQVPGAVAPAGPRGRGLADAALREAALRQRPVATAVALQPEEGEKFPCPLIPSISTWYRQKNTSHA